MQSKLTDEMLDRVPLRLHFRFFSGVAIVALAGDKPCSIPYAH